MKAFVAALVALVVCLAAYWWLGKEAPRVEVAVVGSNSIQQRLDQDGLVKSQTEVMLRAQVNGRVRRLPVTNGQAVRAGQVVIELESDEAQASLQQAEAQRQVALANLAEAQSNLQLTRQRTAAEVKSAQAGVNQSLANYEKIKEGPRSEEIQRSRAQLVQVELRLQDQQRDLQRKETLFRQDALPKRDLETAELAVRQSKAALDEAKASLAVLEKGSRWQETAGAKSELQRSQAQVQVAQAQQGQVEVAESQLETSRARLAAAEADVERSRSNREHFELKAPSAGVLQLEALQVGDTVSMTTVIGRLIDPKSVWIELLIDQADRPKVELGQLVVITSDAFPNSEFKGKVSRVDPAASLKRELRNTQTQDEDRVFRARVDLDSAESTGERKGRLLPGMSVFAELPVGEARRVLTVRRQALLQQDGKWQAYRVVDSRIRIAEVKIGSSDGLYSEALSGLKDGDTVVINPDPIKLKEGLAVRSQASSESPKPSPTATGTH